MADIVERLRFDSVRCEMQFSKGVAKNIEEAADVIEWLRAALGTSSCPRPANGAPDFLTVSECVARGECGCDSGTALKSTGEQKLDGKP